MDWNVALLGQYLPSLPEALGSIRSMNGVWQSHTLKLCIQEVEVVWLDARCQPWLCRDLEAGQLGMCAALSPVK